MTFKVIYSLYHLAKVTQWFYLIPKQNHRAFCALICIILRFPLSFHEVLLAQFLVCRNHSALFDRLYVDHKNYLIQSLFKVDITLLLKKL